MAKDWARSFYNSKAWRACRDSYKDERISIDGGLCEVCRKEIGSIVHHIIELTPENINNPHIALCFDNLRLDCKSCHDWEEGHFYEAHGVKRTRCAFDESGQPIERPAPSRTEF